MHPRTSHWLAPDPWGMLPSVTWHRLTAHLGSLLIGPWLLSHRERHLLNSSGQLKQPNGPIGAVSQVLATHWVGVHGPDLLSSIRRLAKLLTEVVVFCFKIIILTKKTEARFITSLVSSIGDGNIS
jgi:hypothetical protein